MDLLRRFAREAHRRSLWQVLGIYLVGAWIGYQVILNVMQGFGLPDWVAPFSLVLFLIGLPIVIATAVVQEGLPERKDFERGATDPHDLIAGFSTATDDLTMAEPAQSPSSRSPSHSPSAQSPPAAPRSDSPGARLATQLTWPKAIVGGIGAFLVLGFSTAGYMGLRSAGIGPMGTLMGRGEISERDPIVLSEFTSAAGDSLLASAVTEAFRVDFEQSPIVRLVGPQQVADVLGRMQRPTDSPLTEALAREIAEREGYTAVLSGEVNPVGAGYVLSARLLSADGRVLASTRETAADSTQVLAAIDALSQTLRERIGESLRTIRANPPLEQVTTASMDALRKYTQSLAARDQGDPDRALELLEQAIEIDPGFAMAWRKMSAILRGPGFDAARPVHAATRAWELRDRLTAKEQHLAAAAYYGWALGDADAAAREYRSVLDLDPDETTALNNLSLILMSRGEYAAAVELTARATAVGGSFVFIENHAQALYQLDRADEAIATLQRGRELYPSNDALAFLMAVVYGSEGRYAVADSVLTAIGDQRALRDRAGVRWLASSLDAARGRMREAYAHAADFERDGRALSPAEGLLTATWRAQLVLGVERDTAAAVRAIEDAIRIARLDTIAAISRPYLQLATFYARADMPARARELLAEREANVPEPQRRLNAAGDHFLTGLLHIADGDLERALAAFDEARPHADCDVLHLDVLARAYARRGDVRRAIELYEEFLTERCYFRVGDLDADGLAAALVDVAELYEQVGDTESAARNYARFIELWQDADPELQPRVRAARERLESIVRRRG